MNCNVDLMRPGEAVAAEPYEYKECGLEGIFLHNGYDIIEHEGECFVSVEDTEGLHRAIGELLVVNSKELAPNEIRFLRKTMDLTQSELGRWMGKDSQTVARWEKGHTPIPTVADRLLRVIFLAQTLGPEVHESLLEVLRDIEDMDDLTPRRVELYLAQDGHWMDGIKSNAA